MSSRKSAFTSFEKEYLKEILNEYINVLESKRTDVDLKKRKSEIWCKVADEFNSCPKVQHATTQQLRKLWLNMKSRARDAKSLEKQRSHTGGGPYVPDMDPDHESILAMVPHLMPTIHIDKDSDGPGEKDGDDDSFAWKPKKFRNISPDLMKDNFPEKSHEVTVYSMEDHCYEKTPVTSTITSATETIAGAASTAAVAGLSYPSSAQINQASEVKRAEKKNCTISKISSIDMLKAKLIEEDIAQRKIRFEKEMARLDQELENEKKMFDLKYKILLLEYNHKKSMYEKELKKTQNF